jgi:HSP20 family protein
MGFFDDENDPFEDIVREFFGSPGSRKVSRSSGNSMISGEYEERNIDFVETDNYFYVVFELPGYEREDVSVEIKGENLIVNAEKKLSERVADYMAQKLSNGVHIAKPIPKFIKNKKYDTTFSNGVLEVRFKR